MHYTGLAAAGVSPACFIAVVEEEKPVKRIEMKQGQLEAGTER